MTICSHGCDSTECQDCRSQTFQISPDGKLLAGRSESGCTLGCQKISGEYSGRFNNPHDGRLGLNYWNEALVDGTMTWISDCGFELNTTSKAAALASLVRALLGDACGRPLRARATSLLGKYLHDWEFELVLAAAHKSSMSMEQFVVDAAVDEPGHLGVEVDMRTAIEAAHSSGRTLGVYMAEKALEAARLVLAEDKAQ